MADLVDISSRIIDSGVVDQPVNRVTNELSELADDLAIVESFSHCVAFDSGDGLVCFDSSGVHTGEAVVAALKAGGPTESSHLVYTHGHADHVGGSTLLRWRQIQLVVGHENVAARLDRYDYTNNWNLIINARPVRRHTRRAEPVDRRGRVGGARVDIADARRFLPRTTLAPDGDVRQASTRSRSATRRSNFTTPAVRPTIICGRGFPIANGSWPATS